MKKILLGLLIILMMSGTVYADTIVYGGYVPTTGGTITGNLTITGLTASKPVFTDASKQLVSTGTLGVDQGGTGRATGTTAYSLLATGTTATGVQQTLANGATTEILVGGGTSALPAWTTATGTGAPVRGTSPTIATPLITIPHVDGNASINPLTAAQVSGTTIHNYSQSGDVTHVLPAAASGYSFKVRLTTTVAKFFKITAGAGDKIYLDGVAGADAGTIGIASAATGNEILCESSPTDAFDWFCSTISGAWITY